jgi:glycosyltransferase involved in cell wall biosynthesis
MSHQPVRDPTAQPPKVSVCVITYNQERYIRKCLQSLVEQQTSFDFEIIVGDDCSTDGTRKIVQEFQRDHPDRVRLVLQERNTGGTRNYLDVHALARGDYVAHIDGDDVAFPGKLEAQVRALDGDPSCAVVWHRMQVFNDSGTLSVPNLPSVAMWPGGRVQLKDLLRFGSISYHSSTMYRASARKWQVDGHALDWFFTVELMRSGDGQYLDEILGGYRYNPIIGLSRGVEGTLRMRRLYCQHLRRCLDLMPKYRRDLFVNCLINCIVDLVNRRPSWREFAGIALSNFSLVGLFQLPASLRRFRIINPKIL